MTWTPEKIAELARLANLGENGTEIAKRLGKTRNAVLGKCNRLGIKLQKENYVRHNSWTAQETDRLYELSATGMSDTNIAKVMGKSWNSIAQKRAKLGIKKPILPRPAKKPVKVKKIDPREPISKRLLYNQLRDDQCKFSNLENENGAHLFCGHDIVRREYCEYHAGICYRPRQKREKRAGES